MSANAVPDCKKNETLVQWNQMGPQGDPGPKGDTGPTGGGEKVWRIAHSGGGTGAGAPSVQQILAGTPIIYDAAATLASSNSSLKLSAI